MIFNLHIDRLVLDGIALTPHQRDALQTAVQSELGRQLIAHGIGSVFVPRISKRLIQGSSIHISKNPQPLDLAHQVAGAICQGMSANEHGTISTDG